LAPPGQEHSSARCCCGSAPVLRVAGACGGEADGSESGGELSVERRDHLPNETLHQTGAQSIGMCTRSLSRPINGIPILDRQPAGELGRYAATTLSDMNGTVEDAPPHEQEQVAPHGGRAGWFRVACGFSALAAIGMSYQSWSVARPSVAATVFYPSWLAGPLVLGALCLAWASFLAIRRRRSAGLFLVLGYVIPAVALYALQGILVPPSLLLIASMLALIVATRRRHAITGPAA
jgi:hypothetical protein